MDNDFESILNNKTSVKHKVQKLILEYLATTKSAQFSDLVPPKTKTNLFTYHLNTLLGSGLVSKINDAYSLSPKGLAYINLPTYPRVFVALLVQDGYGNLLLQRRNSQPFIYTWSLPAHKYSTQDGSIAKSTAKLLKTFKVKTPIADIKHIGSCQLRISADGTTVSDRLMHICKATTDTKTSPSDNLIWVDPHDLHKTDLTPGTQEIISRSFFFDPFFFEEYDVLA